MSTATLFDAIAASSAHITHQPSAANPLPTEAALSTGERGALAEMLGATRPGFVLCVQQQADPRRLQEIAELAAQAGALPCRILALILDGAGPLPSSLTLPEGLTVTWCYAQLDTNTLATMLTQHETKVDAILLDPAVSDAPLLEWLAAGRTLGQAKVWTFGMHGWDTAKFRTIESAAAAQRLHLTFTANVWIATPEGWTLPRLAAPIAGTVEPVRYGSIPATTDEIWDRAAFLKCIETGVSGYRKHGDRQAFANQLPVNIASQSPEVQEDYTRLHFPPYKDTESTEPHLIASLRNVRVSGVRGYIYSRNNELLEQSFGIGHAGVAALKDLLPPYEPILRKAVATTEQFQWLTMAGVFSPSVHLSEPHIVAMWPDTYIYHHWLVGCLTRFWYLDEYPELADLPIVMNPFIRRYQFEYMEMLGLKKNRLVFSNDSVSLHLKQAIYPTHFGTAPHSPAAIHWLRSKFLKHAAKVPAGYESGLYYISRKDGRSREITNESEVLEFLKPYGFQIVEWSAFSVAEQIAMAHHAKVIIGAHGSNMSNTVYINPACKVLDIRNTKNTGHDLTISAATQVISGKFYATPTYCPPQHGRLRTDTSLDMSHDNHSIDMADFKAVFSQMMDS
ncbi:glycosyltransferase family 61 protein [Rhodoferax saidenbachensis]|uniref:Glycosyltransferase 61 catalytic domain-containing protein n=1 Tax=Rhodoferax saidenbachensis TaxID=1484693 RepID=A0A1P8K6I1_9BURK|nr:glycosyltransferase family 61 protein [Rhodoferax saidenbachensis]APW41620.1 hypothetical protein RS694_02995 [Rhodoferax saidenbachensis]